MSETTALDIDIGRLMEIARLAARKAGEYLLQKLGQAQVLYQKTRLDDLLDADVEAERIILGVLQDQTPGIGVLSEEAGSKKGSTDYCWIVDPLDGSANFQHASPLFGVVIALTAKQSTIGSVIYLPKACEMFTAVKDQGAYLNGAPIKVSTIDVLDKAIVHLGDFAKNANVQTIESRLKDVSRLALRVSRIRMLGTAAADLAYVACGRADILVNHTTKPWDAKAGKLLLLEAGGKTTTTQCSDNTTINVYSNGVIHQAVQDLLIL